MPSDAALVDESLRDRSPFIEGEQKFAMACLAGVEQVREYASVLGGLDSGDKIAVAGHYNCLLNLIIPTHPHQINGKKDIDSFLFERRASSGQPPEAYFEPWQTLETCDEAVGPTVAL